MQTQAAVLWERNTPWSIETIDLDPPKATEVLVELHASGMCHSDDHLVTGDMPIQLPCIGGHEGAGVVKAVGDHVSWLAPGDHVVFSFIPSCGRCPSCSTGHQSLCDLGAKIYSGMQISRRHRAPSRQAIRTSHSRAASVLSHTTPSCTKPAASRSPSTTGSTGLPAGLRLHHRVGIGGLRRGRATGRHRRGRRRRRHRRRGSAGRPAGGCPHDHRDRPVGVQARRGAARWAPPTPPRTGQEAKGVVAEATWDRGADKFICAMGVGDGQLIGQALAMTAKRGTTGRHQHPPDAGT